MKALLLLVAKQRVGYTVAHVATDLRLRLLRALLGTSWSYYTRQPVGLAANAMATEANRGAQSYYYLSLILTYAIQAAIAIGLALAVSWQVTLASGAAALVSIAMLNVFVRMSGRAGRRQTELLKSLLGRLTDVLQAVKLLKATAREGFVGPLLEDDTRRLNKALRKQVLSKEALLALQEPILVTFCGLGLIVGRLALGMPASEVVFLILLFARTLSSVNKTQRKYQQMITVDSALWSLRDMIDAAEREREHSEGTREPTLKQGLTLKTSDSSTTGAAFSRVSPSRSPPGASPPSSGRRARARRPSWTSSPAFASRSAASSRSTAYRCRSSTCAAGAR